MRISRKHIVFALPGYKKCAVEEFFNYGICQVNQAEAIAALGYQVTVVSRFALNDNKERNGVNYLFLNDGKRPVLKRWEKSSQYIQEIIELDADIIHFHGFIFPLLLLELCKLKSAKTKVVAEYHSDPIFSTLNKKQGQALRSVQRLLFANGNAAKLWQNTFNLSSDKIRQSIECSPTSKFMDRTTARGISGFQGSPILLWNSRVISRRNPMIVIMAFERFMEHGGFPNSHFYWMIPDGEEKLIKELKKYVRQSNLLSKSVTLIEERKPHHQLAPYFNSADYIISSSTDDGYGYGIADAMSCGVFPIVTNISTFKQITNNGQYGALWEVNNVDSVFEALMNTVDKTFGDIANKSAEIAAYFDQSLSAQAQANQLVKIYQELFNLRSTI